MPFARYAALAASFVATASAINGIVVPGTIAANSGFQATFEDAKDSDHYRVFLSAAVVGTNGPMCYLKNSTSLSSPVNLTIPAAVGPDAGYYSIGIADLSTGQGTTFSNRFNFTGGSGQPTQYEQHLNGAPFWDASKLPCDAMECARKCANASYPDDLQSGPAYQTMYNCILDCPGVQASENMHAAQSNSPSLTEALVTLGSGSVVTAYPTTLTTSGRTLTEAIVGSNTLTLGSGAATISSATVSLATSGIAVDGTTTVAFAQASQTSTGSAGSGSAGGASSSSTGAAAQPTNPAAFAAVAGLAGAVAMLI